MAYLLRIAHTSEGGSKFSIEVSLEINGLPRKTANSRFEFNLTAQDREDIRWYLEDYLQYPLDPAPRIAARIEKRMAEIGSDLFKAIFQSHDEARDLWAMLREHLSDARVEIVAGVEEAVSIPWELIRDSTTGTPLALCVRSFVRAHSQPAQHPRLLQAIDAPIRILLVICRPGGRADVPFRSVSSRLIKGLEESASEIFQLDVLRPPTFERLSRVLRRAKAEGRPYHIVHFDGHGIYADASLAKALGAVLDSDRGSGAHGYLLFEDLTSKANANLVDGSTLGNLLVETDVPVLVLNACRSAHADLQTAPAKVDPTTVDPHRKVRAFGSLAQELMDLGMPAVVAMRYNVYVVTAAQFVAELYLHLARGNSLGQAVTMSRKQLAASPMREIAFNPVPLQDWLVPVAYEAAPVALFPKLDQAEALTISVKAGEITPAREGLDLKLPTIPDADFVGRDETLLALDRTFDTAPVVLLHGYAGNGKTSTAAEFARWYKLTGGVDGPVLFTSFEHYKPLPRVLDDIGRSFGPQLERSGINWLSLSDEQRRDVALKLLKQVPVLWIWDNVEPVAGFPPGSQSAWSEEEQKQLVNFLRDAYGTKAKVLLTSRRDEKHWLEVLPARIALPSMPMQERVQLARAIAEKQRRKLTDVEDWRPLLNFTQGNPLIVTILVGQALRDGLKTRQQIEAFVEHLRNGEAAFDDEEKEGRSKSLAASLSYGFEHAFTTGELRILALLYLFQGVVQAKVFLLLGAPSNRCSLGEVSNLSYESIVRLLDRAVDIGLLSSPGGGYYYIHPALPWFLKSHFETFYIPPSDLSAIRSFVAAIELFATAQVDEYNSNNTSATYVFGAEEENLQHAWRLAIKHSCWRSSARILQGLYIVYESTGRIEELVGMVDRIAPYFADSNVGEPVSGYEDEWIITNGLQISIAKLRRQWPKAEFLERSRVSWFGRVASSLDRHTTLEDVQFKCFLNQAISLGSLGDILFEMGKPDCVQAYEDAAALSHSLGDKRFEAIVFYKLGNAYLTNPDIRNLTKAEEYYKRSLDVKGLDRLHLGTCYSQLGAVAFESFYEAAANKNPDGVMISHLDDALRYCTYAIKNLPDNAKNDLAVTHNLMGAIYQYTDGARSLHHYNESIRYYEGQNNSFGAALARVNAAGALKIAGRFVDAREYAVLALREFSSFGNQSSEGNQAAVMAQRAKEFILEIDYLLESGRG